MHYLVHNSTAGRGRMPHAREQVLDHFEAAGKPLEVLPPVAGDELTRLLLSLPQDSTVLSLGGDGTLNGVLTAVCDRNLTLGILPAGSADDFACALGFPRDNLTPALAAITNGVTRLVDTAVAELTLADGSSRTVRFANALGSGFDAEVAAQREERFDRLRGPAGYYTALALGWLKLRRESLTVKADGDTLWSGRSLLVSFQNGPRTGGSFHFAPGARVDDGQLDLLLAGNVSRLGLLQLLPKVLGAQPIVNERVLRLAGAGFSFEWSRPRMLHVDGELQGEVRSADIRVEPMSLRVIVPG